MILRIKSQIMFEKIGSASSLESENCSGWEQTKYPIIDKLQKVNCQ